MKRKEDKTDDKKEEEKSIIHPLLEKLRINPDTVDNIESPDFAFTFEGRKIGLELVRCCPSRQYNNGRSLAVCNYFKIHRAMKAYEDLLRDRSENVILDITFSDNVYWSNEKEDVFVERVVKEIDFIRNNKINDVIKHRNPKDNTLYVEDVNLILPSHDEPHVHSVCGQSLQRITQKDFDDCIGSKISKVQKYKSKIENKDIEEYWLAVAILNREPYEFWNFTYKLPTELGYKRVFLIQYDGVKEIFAS